MPNLQSPTTTPSTTVTELLRDPESLVPEKIAARILGLTNARTLSVWRSTGRHKELQFHRIGRCIRYRVRDLIDFRDRGVRSNTL
jgi:hypothetical protein